jgi:protein-L-isoaspartate(D-aspartate) O-methyltransferase
MLGYTLEKMESPQPGYENARDRLVESLRRDIRDERVLSAFARVPRERFVPLELVDQAYEDRALPIGEGQTISQPTMVAIMLEALELAGDERVLEVGTGSGYQAALLSLLAREVITVERIPELAATAANRLQMLGYDNVRVVVAGQELGWPEGAPYDGIVVAAGAPEPPPSLVEQLAPGGRLVVPAGAMRAQQLVRVTKREFGVTLERLGACRFVPLIHADEGWPANGPGHARAG